MAMKQIDCAKNLDNIDTTDLLSAWGWRIDELDSIVLVTLLGDVFLLGDDGAIYWLQTDSGDLTAVADSMKEFNEMLDDEETFEEWFLTPVLEVLLDAGKTLKENEVYSYKVLPVLGGDYTVDNIEPVDIRVHFDTTGQICEQIQDLPDGTEVDINVK
ncbi:T6SS immunity protein Tdi1 domain-containing protein [Polluticoccus soli]|uniref:T6SS immunity protein Tdi1 domain-containing protein n=1 Tax=Polluticoccus soli TaxID=3034150 RepID=UPI0023E2725B|nr:T6SS immunity protein Tdi1 domain-containing protein [Flavipsychrobacter sp. JY13-12]